MLNTARIAFVLVLCALISSTLLLSACSDAPEPPSKRDLLIATNNLHNLVQILTDRSIRRGWPVFNGKNFVLSTVAYGLVDHRNSRNLAVFFSPAATPDPMPGPADYEEVSQSSLKSGDFGHLTSYAGRRNADPEYRLTPRMLARGVPVMADVSMPGYAVIAYSDGSARVRKAADFGLPRGTQITVGDDANVEELRALSLD